MPGHCLWFGAVDSISHYLLALPRSVLVAEADGQQPELLRLVLCLDWEATRPWLICYCREENLIQGLWCTLNHPLTSVLTCLFCFFLIKCLSLLLFLPSVACHSGLFSYELKVNTIDGVVEGLVFQRRLKNTFSSLFTCTVSSCYT